MDKVIYKTTEINYKGYQIESIVYKEEISKYIIYRKNENWYKYTYIPEEEDNTYNDRAIINNMDRA